MIVIVRSIPMRLERRETDFSDAENTELHGFFVAFPYVVPFAVPCSTPIVLIVLIYFK